MTQVDDDHLVGTSSLQSELSVPVNNRLHGQDRADASLNNLEVIQTGMEGNIPVKEKMVVLLGGKGCGKSTLKGLCSANPLEGYAGLKENGTTKVTKHTFQLVSRGTVVTVFDTLGFGKDWPQNRKVLHMLVTALGDDTSKIDAVVFCVKSTRFGPEERSILAFFQRFTTKEFQSLIHIVCTHCPVYIQTPKFIQDVLVNFKSFGVNAENLHQKVTMVDLMNPLCFRPNSQARIEVDEKWVDAQNALYDKIEVMNEGRVPVRKILALNYVHELVTVYWYECLFALLVLIIMISAHYTITYYGISEERLTAMTQCLEEKAKLLKEGEENKHTPPTIIRIVTGMWQVFFPKRS